MQALVWSIVLAAGVGFFLYQIWGRFQVLLLARKADGRDYSLKTLSARVKNLAVYGLAQWKFFRGEQPAGILHAVVFWGFVVLGGQVTTMFLRGWFPEFTLPFAHTIYGLSKDLFQTAVLLGVVILLFRWLVIKPTRLYGFLPAEEKLRSQSHAEAYLILCFIGTIMISGFLYDAAEPNISSAWQPVTSFIASWIPAESRNSIAEIAWWVHNLVVLTFLNLLPRSKHFHIVTALPNVFFGKVENRGRLPKRDFAAENPLFGVSTLPQFSWKQQLDMYSCTECGRCSSVCPATATGKPLAPRQMLLNLRDYLYKQQPALIQKKAVGDEFGPVVSDAGPVIDEVVWSCVQCRACEEACPVNIEYVDKIVDMRQHLVQEASRFPSEMNRAFKGLETQSNPWGISPDERDGWAQGFEVPRLADKPDAEYLYYVGCGGSLDSNNKKTTQSFIKILNTAKVSYAILGKEELCNGETARRLGNEYLFQSMAEALVAVLNRYKVKKILVNCPHCFNTLANEYPDFGGHYEVIRAADLVNQLVAEKRVPLAGNFEKKVVYHDSCNYGRFQGVYDEPRETLKAVPGAALTEIPESREKGTCCGAGGGRMWMEERKDQRVNMLRVDQTLKSKPDVIATSCPFCKIMLGSAVNEKGVQDQVKVMDVMEIVSSQLTP